MPRAATALGFALALIVAGLASAAPLQDVDTKAIAAADAPKASPKAPVPGGLKDENALWWNDPGILKVLSLTDEQRQKMTAYQTEYSKQVPRDRRPDAFHETLVQGDWKLASAENDKVAKMAESSVRLRGKLKIDVLSVLDKKQLQMLADRYPRLIYKPWMRAMRGGAPR